MVPVDDDSSVEEVLSAFVGVTTLARFGTLGVGPPVAFAGGMALEEKDRFTTGLSPMIVLLFDGMRFDLWKTLVSFSKAPASLFTFFLETVGGSKMLAIWPTLLERRVVVSRVLSFSFLGTSIGLTGCTGLLGRGGELLGGTRFVRLELRTSLLSASPSAPPESCFVRLELRVLSTT